MKFTIHYIDGSTQIINFPNQYTKEIIRKALQDDGALLEGELDNGWRGSKYVFIKTKHIMWIEIE